MSFLAIAACSAMALEPGYTRENMETIGGAKSQAKARRGLFWRTVIAGIGSGLWQFALLLLCPVIRSPMLASKQRSSPARQPPAYQRT